MKRVVSKLIILAIILFVAIIVVNHLLDFFNYGLRGRYYAGAKWKGDPLLERIDPLIQFRWDPDGYEESPPPMNSPPFSVEWEGCINIRKAGLYSFALNSDDGSLLYIDDNLLVDNDGPHGATLVWGSRELEKGIYPLKIKYFDIGIQGEVGFYWRPPGQSEEIVPSQVLSLNKKLYLTGKVSKHRKGMGRTLGILKGLETGLLIVVFLAFFIRRLRLEK